MIFRNEKNAMDTPASPEQIQQTLKAWQDWIKDIAAKGRYAGTNRLMGDAKTIKPGNVISDGPYAEVKEVVGGYLIVKADNIDEAMEMAKGCPGLTMGGNVEVRTVMNIEYDTAAKNFLEKI